MPGNITLVPKPGSAQEDNEKMKKIQIIEQRTVLDMENDCAIVFSSDGTSTVTIDQQYNYISASKELE